MLWPLVRKLVLVTSLVVANPIASAEQLKATAEDGNLGLDFKSQYADVNGVKLHYVEGGKGQQTLVLIPGWPQTWYAWRKIMPELAKTYRVIAVDVRGMGDSSRPENGYDTQTAANDIRALMSELGVSRYTVIGHDVGMWIAYPLAAEHGESIDKLVMIEATIPGVTPWPPMLLPPEANAGMAQFMFNQLRDLPEFLVAGREDPYLRWLVGQLAFRPDRVAVDEYVRAYSEPGAMKAGFEYYRAIPLTAQQNEKLRKRKLTMPVLAIGGIRGAGQLTIETMKLVSDNVQGQIIERCGHYTPEECPAELLHLLKSFLAIGKS
ncbi:alpha/beta fold hydrolase [Bradyrhizobium archetypum]|uniref:Alpha/beta hydrolase n=1 Tax=Bradyrhizobium archetypum TaxID=2721160 RepID=A0A7Y4M3N4_9BRAD|nr:alpha/beta hydrolase [Bradyrhizobium archetypum]NOJ48676.1 alpha/beta hydrolase [Bradyrhizobium archetypum]